jgi:hypothetical protein
VSAKLHVVSVTVRENVSARVDLQGVPSLVGGRMEALVPVHIHVARRPTLVLGKGRAASESFIVVCTRRDESMKEPERNRVSGDCGALVESEEIPVVVMDSRRTVAERNQRFNSDSRLRVTVISHNSP